MEINYKTVAVLVIALGGVVAVAYTSGKRHADKPPAANAPVSAPTGATVQRPGAVVALTMPAAPTEADAQSNHPAAAQAPQQQGNVEVDHGANFVHFRVGNRNVKDIYNDGKLVWVGTSGGVVRYDTSTDQYRLFDTRNGLLSNGIFHVSKLDGRIVVGTYGGGMSLYDDKNDKWETYNIPDGLGDAFIYDVLKTSGGDTWIATWSGVNRVRGGVLKDRSKWDLYTVENTKGGVPNDWVYALAEGKNGEIWLATEGGLARFKGGKWTNWNHAKGLGAAYELVKNDLQFKNDPAKVSSHHAKQKQEMGLQGVDTAYNPNYIVSLAVDKEGIVWAGTWGGGLGRFDGAKWRNYTVQDGLPGNHVFMLHVDTKGQLWIGTNNGLARLDGDKFRVFTTADGLFSNTVFSMDIGADGSLWVGSFGGVAHLKGGELARSR